jgi:hypothetical protein
MTKRWTLAIGVIGFVLLTGRLAGQAPAQYRNFTLGGDVASVSVLAGVARSEAKTLHERPAVLQDLEWRPSLWSAGATAPSTDPVERMAFSFYNDQLFRIVVDYGRERTEGMTDADMIEAISAVYGAPVKRPARVALLASRVEVESGSPVARWVGTAVAVTLHRSSMYGESFRLIVTEPRLDVLASKAELTAARLDEQEAPRREVARQKKERDDGRAAAEKARAANKRIFRP